MIQLTWRRSRRRGRRAITEPPDPRALEREILAAFAQRVLAVTHQAIGAVDIAERDDPDPDTLAVLYQVDHPLARVRRTCENLLTVSGFPTAGSTTRPLPLLSVARAAIAECADYTSVTLAAMPSVFIRPGAADDIAHILAELLDNGLSASGGRPVSLTAARPTNDGEVIYAVADNGPLPRPGLLDSLNARLSAEPSVDVNTPRHLGLYVVATLAQQLGVRVQLVSRQGGGITALVEVPPGLLLDPADVSATKARPLSPGSARADRWGPGPRPGTPDETTEGGLPRRTRVATPWTPAPRPELRRPSTDELAGAAALDEARNPRLQYLAEPTGERTRI
jgi:hypothetical protein